MSAPVSASRTIARRDRDDQVRAAAPGLVAAATGLTVLGGEVTLLDKRAQRVERRLDLEVDVAAFSAVAARGAATRHVFFAAEVHNAVTAVAALDLDYCFIICHDAGV